MAEWFIAAVLKTAEPAMVPWVRLPPSPHFKTKTIKYGSKVYRIQRKQRRRGCSIYWSHHSNRIQVYKEVRCFFTDSKKAISHKDGTIKITDGETTIESFPLDVFESLEDLDTPK